MKTSTYLGLNLPVGSDTVDLINQYGPNFEKIDSSFAEITQPSDKAFFDYRGFNFRSQTSTIDMTAANSLLDTMVSIGCNYVVINEISTMPTISSTTITRTIADDQLTLVIQAAKSRGLKVALKPMINPQDGNWRAYIRPTIANVSTFFTNYQNWLMSFANLCTSQGCDMLVVSTELSYLTKNRFASNWQTVISAIRGAFTGLVATAAQLGLETDPTNEAVDNCLFSLVDVIGFDAYPNCTNLNTPTVSQLEAGIMNDTRGIAYLNTVTDIANKYGKPVIIAETGICSATGANKATGNYLDTPYNEQQQADYYTAFFNVYRNYMDIMKGVFFWNMNTSLGDADNIQGKLAESVVRGEWA